MRGVLSNTNDDPHSAGVAVEPIALARDAEGWLQPRPC